MKVKKSDSSRINEEARESLSNARRTAQMIGRNVATAGPMLSELKDLLPRAVWRHVDSVEFSSNASTLIFVLKNDKNERFVVKAFTMALGEGSEKHDRVLSFEAPGPGGQWYGNILLAISLESEETAGSLLDV